MQKQNHYFCIPQNYDYRNEIISNITTLLNFYTEKHSKVLVVRFDVRYPKGYTGMCSNAHISKCMAYVIKKYKRQKLDPYYMWIREQDFSPYCHFHSFLLLDAQKVLEFSHVFKTVAESWQRTLGWEKAIPESIHHYLKEDDPDYNGKVIRRDAGPEAYAARKQDVFNQLSYLAKSFTKAPDNDGMRNFGMSWIPTISKSKAVPTFPSHQLDLF